MYVAAVEYTVSPKKVTGDLYFYQKNNGKIEPPCEIKVILF